MTSPAKDSPACSTAIEFLYERLNYERFEQPGHTLDPFKLDQMVELLKRLDNPQDKLRIVHIAGTKGKGSTSVFVSAMLTAAGYRTGCYTSPHLARIEERFAMDGQSCTSEELVELVELVRPAVTAMDEAARRERRDGPTFFEVTTAMAFLYFVRRQADYVVLEVGLGGRLDSTNVCHPLLCIITTISFDHMRQLGNTLALIAGEKAGIIKPHIPVVTGVTQEEPWTVIRDIAASRHAPLWQLGRDFDFDYHAPRWASGSQDARSVPRFDYYHVHDGQRTLVARDIELSAWGHHQAANATVAWSACERLRDLGLELPDSAMRAGLLAARCSGRVEILPGSPVVLIDTAHNGASIDALVAVLRDSFPQQPKGLILAATQGKDVDAMLHPLVRDFDIVCCTRYLENPRGMPADELTRHARRIATAEGSLADLFTADSPREAWEKMSRRIPPAGLLCATGSFFLAAELKQLIDPGTS